MLAKMRSGGRLCPWLDPARAAQPCHRQVRAGRVQPTASMY